MGVPVRLVLYPGDEAETRAATAAFARIAALDRMMSDYRPDSELASPRRAPARRGRRQPRSLRGPQPRGRRSRAAPTARSIRPSDRSSRSGARRGRSDGCLPARALSTAARARVGWRRIELDSAPAVRFAFRGQACASISAASPRATSFRRRCEVLRAHGVTARPARSRRRHRRRRRAARPRGLADRRARSRRGVRWHTRARLTNAALATSGPTSQFVEIDGVRYSHVIDPRTGLGLTNDLSRA